MLVFFFKQKTAYEMRISDWSSDVCSSDLMDAWLSCAGGREVGPAVGALLTALVPHLRIALRSFVAFEREKFRSSVTSEAFGRLNSGWLTLDARCRIVDMTAQIGRAHV